MRTPKLNRRYKLHQHLRKKGEQYNPNERTIYTPSFDALSLYALELKENHGYAIQLTL